MFVLVNIRGKIGKYISQMLLRYYSEPVQDVLVLFRKLLLMLKSLCREKCVRTENVF